MERWKFVKGFEGDYLISDQGRVKSCLTGRILKPYKTPDGYLKVELFDGDLTKSGKGHQRYVHRLVAEAFLPNPKKLPIVNHKNAIKTDNRLQNIEFCSYQYNRIYGIVLSRIKKIMQEEKRQ